MLHPQIIEMRLRRIISWSAEAGGLPGPGGFGLTEADKVRIEKDHASGRFAIQKASMAAWRGMDALNQGDTEAALVHLCDASDYMLTAFAARVPPSRRSGLLKRREKAEGRPPGPTDLADRVSAAMAEQSPQVDLATLTLALRANPKLNSDFKKLGIKKPSLLKRVRLLRRN